MFSDPNSIDIYEKVIKEQTKKAILYKEIPVELLKFSKKLLHKSWKPYNAIDYQLLERLGKGGFAETYKAYNKRSKKYVALKVGYSGKLLKLKFFKKLH